MVESFLPELNLCDKLQGFARFSLSAQPDPTALKTIPSMGLKFLRDGVDSANLVALHAFQGQESWNFFKNDFTTIVGPGDFGDVNFVLLGIKFAESTKYVTQCGLSDFAAFGEDGQKASTNSFPFMLRFRPTGEISFPDEYVNDFPHDLCSVPNGSTLYNVFALDNPEDIGGTETHIADVVLTSNIVTSNWADKHLFFRHQDMADDVALRPEWKKYLGTFRPNSCPWTGCPTSKLLN